MSAVGLVHVEDGVGSGAGTSEGVENDSITIEAICKIFQSTNGFGYRMIFLSRKLLK